MPAKAPLKKPRGRPPKPAAEKASEVLYLKLTPAERAALDTAAKRAGAGLSVWARRVLLRAARRS